MDLNALIEMGNAKDLDELRRHLVRFTHALDFSTFSASLVTDLDDGGARFDSVQNVPTGYEAIFSDELGSKRDPVLARLKHASFPVIWDQLTYVQAGAGDLYEEQAPWGFKTGISLVTHMPGGRHVILALDREQPLPKAQASLARVVADVHLALAYVQEAATHLLTAPQHLPAIKLTERERAFLRWTLEGRSNWVIGQYMNKSENTIKYYGKCAMAKLDCASKHAAAIKAARLGLLD